MRLIDADEVIEKLKENATEMEADIYYGSNIGVPVDEIEDIVNECKTIDQKRGHWEYNDTIKSWTCSNCGCKTGLFRPKFCFHCGAEMERSVEENEIDRC